MVIDDVTTPMPGDRRSRFRFLRHHARHQGVLDRAWATSGGTCTLIGEWHTHPEPDPAPSLIDQLTWRRKLMADEFSGHLVFLIVGTKSIRGWEGRRHGIRLRPLRGTD